MRGLPGATVLQILPALDETPAARAAVDVAVALLRSGARVIVAAEDGPLNSELQGLGGEWVRLVTESGNPLTSSATPARSPIWCRPSASIWCTRSASAPRAAPPR